MASMNRFYRRRFLNRRGHHTGAYVLADVTIETVRADERPFVCAHLAVADCGRVADLDFDVNDADEARNALIKVLRLREAVDGFAAALEGAIVELHGEVDPT